jgi:ADP-heptose:LPS heptosyltransferase
MDAPKKILVVQLRRLGDVVLTTPAVSALKRKYPKAKIDFLVEEMGAQALAGHPDIDEIIVYRSDHVLSDIQWAFKIRSRQYDWVIEFLANPRTALLTAISGATIKAGPAHVRRRWAYNQRMTQSQKTIYAANEKIHWLSVLGIPEEQIPTLPKLSIAQRPDRPTNVIGLVPPSRQLTRRWPASSYARLGRIIHQKYKMNMKIFWGPGEKSLAEEVARGIGPSATLIQETKTIADLAHEIATCRLIISNCSGPKHIAVGLGVPTVTIHGSSDPSAWTPQHPDHLFVRLEELECIGCRSNVCKYHLECLEQLPPEKVMSCVDQLMGRMESPV